jgi:hypothetical protein
MSAVRTLGQGVGGEQSTPATAAVRQLSFPQASHRGVEQSQVFTGIQLGGGATGTSTVTVGNGPISLLATSGYLRGVLIDLSTSTAANNGTANNDWPFAIINLLRLHDTNGATMHEHSGYLNYLLNLFGHYWPVSDMSQWPDYSSSATSPSCQWYLPVELQGDGFGALANQSAADTYKLDLVLDTPANNYSSSPSTANPIFTIRIFCDYWTLPGTQDMLGRPQQQEPDYHGVAQYSYQSTGNSASAGSMTAKIGFTGNMYRLLIFVGRTSGSGYATGGARTAGILPDPYTLRYDTRDLMIGTARERRAHFFGMLQNPNTTFLTGVYAFLWNYGLNTVTGDSGGNEPEYVSWLPTLPATRFELTGTWAAGTYDYLANTVSVAETSPALRGVSPSATGYAPPVAPTVPAA